MALDDITAGRGYVLQVFGAVGETLTLENASLFYRTLLDVLPNYGVGADQLAGCKYHDEPHVAEPHLNIGFAPSVSRRIMHSISDDINTARESIFKSTTFVRLPVFATA
jgi:hypothetical protein